MAVVVFQDLAKALPRRRRLGPIQMRAADGELIAILGPRGAGKTQLLRLIAGLEGAHEGRISIAGRDVTAQAPQQRKIAMLFPGYALHPHVRSRDIVELPLRLAGLAPKDVVEKTDYFASLTGATPFLNDKPPDLGTEERFRVALARALARSPQLLLLDDPFLSMEESSKQHLRLQLRDLQRSLRITTLLATRSQLDAMAIGDRVGILHEGGLAQLDTPAHLYRRPASTLVASAVGSPAINIFEVRRSGDELSFGNQSVTLPEAWAEGLGSQSKLLLGFRPESFELGGPRRNRFMAVLDPSTRQMFGSHTIVHGQMEGHSVRVQLAGTQSEPATRAYADPERAHVFSAETSQRLTVG